MAKNDLQGVEEDRRCFVCGQQNEHGLKAVFEIVRKEQKSYCRIMVPDQFQGWADVVHGGILASLLDEACIYACQSAGKQFVTAELTVKYRKPVIVGTELLITGELLEQRKRIWQVRAQVVVDGTVHAEAIAKVFALDPQGSV